LNDLIAPYPLGGDGGDGVEGGGGLPYFNPSKDEILKAWREGGINDLMLRVTENMGGGGGGGGGGIFNNKVKPLIAPYPMGGGDGGDGVVEGGGLPAFNPSNDEILKALREGGINNKMLRVTENMGGGGGGGAFSNDLIAPYRGGGGGGDGELGGVGGNKLATASDPLPRRRRFKYPRYHIPFSEFFKFLQKGFERYRERMFGPVNPRGEEFGGGRGRDLDDDEDDDDNKLVLKKLMK